MAIVSLESENGRAKLASCQSPTVGLRIEVYLDHLAPTSWPNNTENISDITAPSIRVYTASNHLAMNKIISVGSKREA
jgi:hypothetical protein